MTSRTPLRSLGIAFRTFTSSSSSSAASSSSSTSDSSSNAVASSSSQSSIPAPIPKDLRTTLSSIRAGVFNTAHNPSNERTGAKYLRRRLRGPSMMRYYPKLPSLRSLNAVSPYNPYVNWEGLPPATWASIGSEYGSKGQHEAWKAKTWGNKSLGEGQVVEQGYTEVERVKGAGWVDDAHERLRGEEVVVRRLMGKGPPKKGQGKRSQMKKR